MSFLVSLAASLIEWLLGKLAAFGLAKVKEIEQTQATEAQTKKDVQEVKDAKSDEDRAKAAADIGRNTFGN